MVVCQYYLRGSCKYGINCRNEHPMDGQRRSSFGNSSWKADSAQTIQAPFSIQSMTADMDPSADKPIWPLSCYAPSKLQPTLLTDLDESPEELRVKAAIAAKTNQFDEYMKYESDKLAAAEQRFAMVRANMKMFHEQALKNFETMDIVVASFNNAGPSSGPSSSSSAFGASASTSVFGRPSPLGAGTSAFGKPAFGQSAFAQPIQSTSAFGTVTTGPSAFAQAANGPSAFAQIAKSGVSVFGQASPAPVSVFGQPVPSQSAFGQPAPVVSAFGQVAQGGSTFGQPAQGTSAFGQPTQNTSVFGQSSFRNPSPQSSIIKPASGAFGSSGGGGAFSAYANQGAASAFGSNAPTSNSGGGGGGAFAAFAGQPSAFGLSAANNIPDTMASVSSGPAFGQTGFGNPTPVTPSGPTSAFGNTVSAPASVFGTPPSAPTSAFGTSPAAQTSAFGIPLPAPTSAFGVPATPQSAFGTLSAFGTPPQQNAPTSAFGAQNNAASAFGTSSDALPNAFSGLTTTQSAFGSAESISAFNTSSGNGSVSETPLALAGSSTFNSNATPSRVQTGAPDFGKAKMKATYKPGITKYDMLLPGNYLELIPKVAMETFKSARFEWGKIPEWIPPTELR